MRYIGKDIIIKQSDILAIFNIQYLKNKIEYKSIIKELSEKFSLDDAVYVESHSTGYTQQGKISEIL